MFQFCGDIYRYCISRLNQGVCVQNSTFSLFIINSKRHYSRRWRYRFRCIIIEACEGQVTLSFFNAPVVEVRHVSSTCVSSWMEVVCPSFKLNKQIKLVAYFVHCQCKRAFKFLVNQPIIVGQLKRYYSLSYWWGWTSLDTPTLKIID